MSDFEVSLLMSYDTLVGMKQAMTHWLFDYDNLVMSYDIFVIRLLCIHNLVMLYLDYLIVSHGTGYDDRVI